MPSAGRMLWAHSDPGSDLQSLAAQGSMLAKSQTWDESTEAERAFRAWLASVMASVSSLGPTPPVEVVDGDASLDPIAEMLAAGRRYVVQLRPATRADDYDWQNAIVIALAALASGHGARAQAALSLPAGTTRRIVTEGANPPFEPTADAEPAPAGVLPGVVGAIVVVSCVGLVGGTIGWITSQYYEAKAIGLTADAKAKQTAAAIQASVDVIEKHQAAQIAQNKTLAYDAGELTVLEALRSSIRELSGWEPPALKSAPNLSGATQAIGAGMGIGTAIILAVAAALLMGRGQARATT